MNPLIRLPLALVALSVALLLDFVATAGEERLFGVALGRALDEREQTFRRHARILLGILALATIVLVLIHPWPGGAFAGLLGFCVAAPCYLAAAQHRARTRLADSDLPGPRIVGMHGVIRWRDMASAPLHLLSVATTISCALFFRWLSPHLPSVARFTAAVGAHSGFAEPNRLWWTLGLLAFNTSVMVFVGWAVTREPWAAETQRTDTTKLIVQRRGLLVRMVEVIMVGLNLAALVGWVGAALALVPGQRPGLAGRTAIAAACIGGLFLMFALLRYLPPLARIRGRLGESTPAETDPSDYHLLGQIYVSRSNPSIFVPKKFGLGTTLNVARPAAWVFIALIVLGPLLFVFATTR